MPGAVMGSLGNLSTKEKIVGAGLGFLALRQLGKFAHHGEKEWEHHQEDKHRIERQSSGHHHHGNRDMLPMPMYMPAPYDESGHMHRAGSTRSNRSGHGRRGDYDYDDEDDDDDDDYPPEHRHHGHHRR